MHLRAKKRKRITKMRHLTTFLCASKSSMTSIAEGVISGEKVKRRNEFIYLEIDTMVRRGELSIQVSDFPYAL